MKGGRVWSRGKEEGYGVEERRKGMEFRKRRRVWNRGKEKGYGVEGRRKGM